MTKQRGLLIRVLILITLLLPCHAGAQSWYEPARGSAERTALIDALRPFAEFVVGSPVEFVINSLRVSGDVAFISATAQRPGGAPINPIGTPAERRGAHDPVAGNLDRYHALYVKSFGVWQVKHRSYDAGDVWWSDPALCIRFAPVTPEAC